MAPDIDAIVQAMRSDLGPGRVDDLELDNGQRGQGQRPGQHPLPAGRRPIANPKRPTAEANRWNVAIQQGKFDDDDAEMVKGLDRIGGGRLHALSSAPLPPPPKDPKGKKPFGPFGPGGHGTATQKVTHPVQGTMWPKNPQKQPPPPKKSQKVVPPQRPPPPAMTRPPPPPANEPPKTPRPQVPEPANYYYKVEVQVGDRLEKGKGAVYLVKNEGTEADVLYVYLEGSVYLKYPLMSMFNYFTTDTQLCLQFKEQDGVSITTTALDFGPQAKMVEFMQAVRTLTKAKRQNIAEAASSKAKAVTTPTAPSAAIAVPSAPVSAPVSGPVSGLVSTPSAAPSSKASVDATPAEPANPVLEPSPSFAVMAVDLVDLSQSTDTVEANRHARTNRMSTYAMDLESLCSSPTQTGSEMASTDTEVGADSFRFAPFQLPQTPIRETTFEKTSVLGAAPVQQENIRPVQKSTGSLQDLMQAQLCTIFPALAAMDELLSEFDKVESLYIVKKAITQLQVSRDSIVEEYLPSAIILMQALTPPADTSPANPTKGPQYTPLPADASPASPTKNHQYTRDAMMRLQHRATAPPQFLMSLKTIPGLAKDTDKTPTAGKLEKSAPSRGKVAAPDGRTESTLKPNAAPFQPSPESKTKGQHGVLGSDKGVRMDQTVLVSANTSAPIPGPDAVSLQAKSAGVGPKGLAHSKWATPDPKEGMHRFTGTKSQDTRIAFTYRFADGNCF